MLETLGASIGVVLGVLAILGLIWRFLLLPNLREQLLKPVDETRRQVTENRHLNRQPTVLDRLDDLQNHVDLLALNQLAVLRKLGAHMTESAEDRHHLWLMVESLIHEHREGEETPHDDSG